MSGIESECYVVGKHRQKSLCISELSGFKEIDCGTNSQIGEIELNDCSSVSSIRFDPSTIRMEPLHLRIGGNWSGSLQVQGEIGSLSYADHKMERVISIPAPEGHQGPIIRSGVGGLISNDIGEIMDGINRFDDLLYLPEMDESEDISIGLQYGQSFRHLGICGPAKIRHIHISCTQSDAQSIVLRNLPELESVTIDGFVTILDIGTCPNLTDIRGNGNIIRKRRLAKFFRDINEKRVNLNGIWISTEGTFRRRSPTTHEIRTCEDIPHARLQPRDYEMQVLWSELTGIEICEVMEGLTIPQMIEIVEEKGMDFFTHLREWFTHLPTLSEQYHAMRFVAALSPINCIPSKELWIARDCILASNRFFSKASPVLLDDRSNFNRWHGHLFGHISEVEHRMRESKRRLGRNPRNTISDWFIPDRGFIAFERMDMEIWIETGGISFDHGIVDSNILFSTYPLGRVRNSLDAVLCFRDDGPSRERQESLIDIVFSDLDGMFKHDPAVFDNVAEFLIESGFEKIPNVVNNFIRSLIDSSMNLPGKVAIGAAILQHIDDIHLRSLMSTAKSAPEMSRTEALSLHALSVSGRRAFSRGLVPKIGWPACHSWRIIHAE